MRKPLLPLLLLAAPVLAAEQDAAGLGRVLACAGIESAIARLDCFDRESRPLIQARGATGSAASTPPPVVVAPPAPVAAPPSSVVAAPPSAATPSLGEEQLKSRDRPEESTAPSEMRAHIETLRNGSGGVYFITLDNGQVWRHESGGMADYLSPGAAVTISKAALGSYRLTLDAGRSKNWIRVSRVR